MMEADTAERLRGQLVGFGTLAFLAFAISLANVPGVGLLPDWVTWAAAGAMVGTFLPALVLSITSTRLALQSMGQEEALAMLRERRDGARWSLIVGVGMLFASGIHVGLGVGGAIMVCYGAAAYLYWTRRIKAVWDPWDDPEIDAWEREMYGD